jgi:hypothetical protein
MANYLTGEATYVDGWLDEMAICCIDEPDEEMTRLGILHETYVDTAERVIESLDAGSTLAASFRQGDPIPVAVVVIAGRKTLEVVQMGQPAERRSLRNLPPVTTEAKNAWCQKFYDAFRALNDEAAAMLPMSNLAYDSYAEHGHKDPAAVARELFDSKTAGTAPA